MSEISPRPWYISGIYVKCNDNKVVMRLNADISVENLRHILKCVNAYDSLVAENEQLREQFEVRIRDSIVAKTFLAMSEDIEQLRQALRKCNYSFDICPFCKEYIHADDCEYIKLIGGEG
jgi:hypothetical protein